MLFKPTIGHQCVSGFSCINKYEYSIKGSIIASLNIHFEFGLQHWFKKIIIELIGSSSVVCESRLLIDH
jgi:hypothetical protein